MRACNPANSSLKQAKVREMQAMLIILVAGELATRVAATQGQSNNEDTLPVVPVR